MATNTCLCKIRNTWNNRFRVEVETRNLEEVNETLDAGADIIMLDNMDEKTCGEAVRIGAGRVLFEASGNMNLQRIENYYGIGIDYISVGALTHSVRAFDYSMRMVVDE